MSLCLYTMFKDLTFVHGQKKIVYDFLNLHSYISAQISKYYNLHGLNKREMNTVLFDMF